LESRQIAELPAPLIIECHSIFFAECIENYADKDSYKKFALMQTVDVKVRLQWE
jgi:hypothetical protein